MLSKLYKANGEKYAKYCHFEGCSSTKRIFNDPTEKVGIYCKTHAGPNMIIIGKIGCSICHIKYAIFGLPEQKASHCGDCKEIDMIDVHHAACNKCKKLRPCFGYEGESATRCSKCKEPGMIDVNNPFCDKCKIVRPIFGYEG